MKAFENAFWGMFILSAFFTTDAFAKRNIAKSKYVAETPCEDQFRMKLEVSPVDGLGDASPVGLKLQIEKPSYRGLASHIHNEESGEFSKKKCEFWQKKFWPMVSQMKVENERPGRERLVCRNIASLEYTLKGKPSRTQFCLGDARSDGLTYLFHRFYDGTEYLLGI